MGGPRTSTKAKGRKPAEGQVSESEEVESSSASSSSAGGTSETGSESEEVGIKQQEQRKKNKKTPSQRGRGRQSKEQQRRKEEDSEGTKSQGRRGGREVDGDSSGEESDERSTLSGLGRVSVLSEPYHKGEEGAGGNSEEEDLLSVMSDLDDDDIDRTRATLHDMIDTCNELDETGSVNFNQDKKRLSKQINSSAFLFEAQFMPGSRIIEKNKSRWEKLTPRKPVTDDDFDPQACASGTSSGASSSKTNRSKSADAGPSGTQKSNALPNHTPNTMLRNAAAMGAQLEHMKPSYMMLHYKHTNILTGLMLKGSQDMDKAGGEGIDIEEYWMKVGEMAKKKFEEERPQTQTQDSETEGDEDDEGTYGLENALDEILSSTSKISSSSAVSIFGIFDHKEFLEKENLADPTTQKEKKQVVRRKQFDPDAIESSQVQVHISKEASAAKSKENDAAVKRFQQCLTKFSAGKEDVNLFEFAVNKNSEQETLNNVFQVAFGVKDGTIGLAKEDNIMVKIRPEEPEPELPEQQSGKKKKKEGKNRTQCIISFSAVQLRAMMEQAKGPNAIPSKPQETR